MKIFFIILLTLGCVVSKAQMTESHIMTSDERNEVFPKEVCENLGIDHSDIFRIYEFDDDAGLHYLVLTENPYDERNDRVLSNQINAFCYTKKEEKLVLDWDIIDFIDEEEARENSIWFWTKFVRLEDEDGDGIVEPIIVYGTSASNGIDDGRVKIFVYYYDKKYAIRHQNDPMDWGRNTTVDKEFYDLPESIQNQVISIMNDITDAGFAIFPAGWKEAMKSKKTYFDEN